MEKNLSVAEHLIELRNRILLCVVFFLAGFIISYIFENKIFNFILKMGRDIGFHFVYISPAEIIVEQIKVAAILGLFLIFPIIFIEIFIYVNPAFKIKALKIITPVIVATILFLAGAVFAYKILIPFSFNFFYELGIKVDIEPQISVQKYIDLFISLFVGVGFAFELPLLSFILTKIGLITDNVLKKGRRIAILGCLIIGAILTPPDIFSQVIVALPMYLLYEISILVSRLASRKTRQLAWNG